MTHHRLGLAGVSQQRNTAGDLDLVYDPVPIADCFQGDGRAGWELREEALNGSPLVVHPDPVEYLPLPVADGKDRVPLVRVTPDLIMGLLEHVAPPVHGLIRNYQCSRRCNAFI